MKKTARAIHNVEDPDYLTSIEAGEHKFIIDEPASNGGQGAGASPSQHLCAALSSCTAITLKMYLNRKDWHVKSIEVYAEKETQKDGQDHFLVEVIISGVLNPEQLKRIEIIASKCPIHKIVARGNPVKLVILQN